MGIAKYTTRTTLSLSGSRVRPGSAVLSATQLSVARFEGDQRGTKSSETANETSAVAKPEVETNSVPQMVEAATSHGEPVVKDITPPNPSTELVVIFESGMGRSGILEVEEMVEEIIARHVGKSEREAIHTRIEHPFQTILGVRGPLDYENVTAQISQIPGVFIVAPECPLEAFNIPPYGGSRR